AEVELPVFVTLETQAFYAVGDGKFYFGTEDVQQNEPVTDSQNNLVYDNDGNVVLYTAATIVDAHNNPIKHRRGAPILRFDNQFGWIEDTYTLADFANGQIAKKYLGREPKLYLGGELAYASAADAVLDDTTVYHVGVASSNVDANVWYRNLEDVQLTTGNGADLITVVNTHAGPTEDTTTGGADQIAVRSIAGATT